MKKSFYTFWEEAEYIRNEWDSIMLWHYGVPRYPRIVDMVKREIDHFCGSGDDIKAVEYGWAVY